MQHRQIIKKVIYIEKKEVEELKVSKNIDFPEWYAQVVLKAGLADYAPVSGCMIIRPYGYAVWENIQKWFDAKLKSTGVENAYFPLFIPERFLKKEAEHFEGFVPEVAWIEKKDENEERYALRPTSETIMYDSFAKWIRSWRDLPLRINQWCNIVRWEVKATKLFLRTREFLWQEGHTAHATKEEADKEVALRARQYKELIETQLAIPVLLGKKSKSETFAGALYTVALEALMPDGKALQMATSHQLGQHFSKAFDIKYRDKDGKEKHVWQTSWGLSTRTLGAVVMVHGDNKGLILPPKIAPIQVVIIPIYTNKSMDIVLKESKKLFDELKDFKTLLDDRDIYSPGWKFNEWELKGVPLRLEIGPKDIENNRVILVRRDTGEKIIAKRENVRQEVDKLLKIIQENLFEKAKKLFYDNIKEANNYSQLANLIKNRRMVKAYWCGDEKCEQKVKEETAATIRITQESKKTGMCAICRKKTKIIAYFAKAY